MGKTGETRVNRRDFFKIAGATGAAVAAAGLAGCAPQVKGEQLSDTGSSSGGVNPADIDWGYEADVVVVGSGSSGSCAAIEAAQAGSSVIIFEKNDFIYGGDSQLCGGSIQAAGYPDEDSLSGIPGDSAEKWAEQLVRWAQGFGDADMIREACMRSGDTVKWLTDMGRVYTSYCIVPPIWSRGDTDDGIFARTLAAIESIQGEDGHIGTLRKHIDQLPDITIEMGAEVAHIVRGSDGAVIGVQLADGSYAKARKGVVLACASVDNNREMAEELGLYQQVWGLTLEEMGLGNPGCPDIDTNTGDGIKMLREIGADLVLGQACCMNDAIYTGGIGYFGGGEPNIYGNSPTGPSIIVNRFGRRFCQDDAEWGYLIAECAKEAYRQGFDKNEPSKGFIWYVCDSKNSEKTIDSVAALIGEAAVSHKADTIEGLAEQMGCNPAVLKNEIDKWNSYVEAGEDLDFGRRDALGKIDTPPFYCGVMSPGPMGTFAGAKTNIKTEVIGLDGEVIPRLYAAGTVAGGMWNGPYYFGCGWSILNTVVWGREAGQNVAALDSWA